MTSTAQPHAPQQRARWVSHSATLMSLLLLAACSTPMDARKDQAFQSYASQSDRPVVRPTRSISSFSASLMCMDHMLRDAQLPPTLITSKQIPDYSSRVPVASKDMIVTALSQMSRVSNAFRFVDYEVDIARQDTVQNLTTILLNNNQMQLQRPALYFSGAISYVDQNVISNRYDVGTSASRLDTGYSQSRNATIIALELHLGDFRTRTLIPGLDSANEVIIGGGGQGLDLAGRIGDYGVKFNIGRDYAQGAGGAMRTLIDLATIELVGKWAHVPYWQCLTLEQTHPNFQRQMREWYDASGPAGASALVQTSLVNRGYLPLGTATLPTGNRQLHAALTSFQTDSGLVVSGLIDFSTYENALRHYVAFAPDGSFERVGWTSDGPVRTALAPAADVQTAAATEPSEPTGTSDILQAGYTLAAAPTVNRVLLQIENPAPAGERLPFEQGEQVFLSAMVTRSAYLYCYFADSKGGIMRLIPNAIHPNPLVPANMSLRIPDWMTPNPAFIMDAGAPGTERVACFATDTDLMPTLPAPLQGPALKAVSGFTTMDAVADAFRQASGTSYVSRGEIEWQVVAKRAAVVTPAAAAAPPSAAASAATPR